ncbi:hypothetical protein GTP45_05210 [Pseudoduganella sp. FT55W]|uniref:Uncharacterized protein n=1 Tax=Duganella rivi TaxID=2666083 RepID=A0A7X4KAH7_9BURK|nr:hypothetical protein [Duganella rivi]MYM66234.1 hypothetical protein [Duganella rivi]
MNQQHNDQNAFPAFVVPQEVEQFLASIGCYKRLNHATNVYWHEVLGYTFTVIDTLPENPLAMSIEGDEPVVIVLNGISAAQREETDGHWYLLTLEELPHFCVHTAYFDIHKEDQKGACRDPIYGLTYVPPPADIIADIPTFFASLGCHLFGDGYTGYLHPLDKLLHYTSAPEAFLREHADLDSSPCSVTPPFSAVLVIDDDIRIERLNDLTMWNIVKVSDLPRYLASYAFADEGVREALAHEREMVLASMIEEYRLKQVAASTMVQTLQTSC